MVYSFDEPDAPERHDLQYFEMAGNRGIYHKGWSAVTQHSTPWLPPTVAARVGRRRVGALRRQRPTGPRPTTSPPSSPTGSRSCSGCG